MRIIGKVVLVLVVIALSSVTRTVQVSVFISLSLREKRETKNDVFLSIHMMIIKYLCHHTHSHTVNGRCVYVCI